MKTAEEWMEKRSFEVRDGLIIGEITLEDIRKIQDDAREAIDGATKEEWAAQFALAMLEQVVRQDGGVIQAYETTEIADNAKKMADLIFGEEKADE